MCIGNQFCNLLMKTIKLGFNSMVLVSSGRARQYKSDTTHPQSVTSQSRTSSSIQRHQSMSIASRLASRTAKEYFDSQRRRAVPMSARNTESDVPSYDGLNPSQAKSIPVKMKSSDLLSHGTESSHRTELCSQPGKSYSHDHMNNTHCCCGDQHLDKNRNNMLNECDYLTEEPYLDSGFASEASHRIYCNITPNVTSQCSSLKSLHCKPSEGASEERFLNPLSGSHKSSNQAGRCGSIPHCRDWDETQNKDNINTATLSFYSLVRRQRLSQSSKGTMSSRDSQPSKKDCSLEQPADSDTPGQIDSGDVEELLDGRGLFSCASISPLYFSKMRLSKHQQQYYANQTRKSL